MVLAPDLVKLFDQAIAHTASDIHLVADEIPRMRVHGELIPVPEAIVYTVDDMAEHFVALLPAISAAALRNGSIATTEMQVPYSNFTFLIFLFRNAGELSATIRILTSSAPTLKEVAGDVLPFFRGLATRESGLILISGPVGSGKQTTAFALLQEINTTRQRRIHLLEDGPFPRIKSERCLVSSVQIPQDVPDVNSGLHLLMRGADPDIIYLSDLPGADTVQTLLELARSGHLIIANANAPSAASALVTITQALPDSALSVLSQQIIAVTNQRLFRRAHQPGRVPAYEILSGNEVVRNAIEDRQDAIRFQQIMESGMDGMRTLPSALEQLIAGGVIEEQSRNLGLNDYL